MRSTLLLLAVVLIVAVPAADVVAKEKPKNFAQVALDGAVLGKPITTNQLMLFPIYSFKPSTPPNVEVAQGAKSLTFREVEPGHLVANE